ncbi:DUF3021 domain-containing protein [Domibacillus indicus]|uniref:DUF3021 domain-containing protein n=1 Tax=Domibacillus indicus TaxID=1437523 RepID=UPI0006182428|nr:DUF3021 domain-containing protein [Domibacillus indicus]
MKRFLLQGAAGVFFGAFLMTLAVFAAVWTGQESLNGSLFVKNAIGFMLCGWLFAVTPLFFEIQSLRLIQQTALHFFAAACPYFVLAFTIGWVPFNLQSALFAVLVFLLIYVIIWLSFYFYFKREARRMNEKLNRL